MSFRTLNLSFRAPFLSFRPKRRNLSRSSLAHAQCAGAIWSRRVSTGMENNPPGRSHSHSSCRTPIRYPRWGAGRARIHPRRPTPPVRASLVGARWSGARVNLQRHLYTPRARHHHHRLAGPRSGTQPLPRLPRLRSGTSPHRRSNPIRLPGLRSGTHGGARGAATTPPRVRASLVGARGGWGAGNPPTPFVHPARPTPLHTDVPPQPSCRTPIRYPRRGAGQPPTPYAPPARRPLLLNSLSLDGRGLG